MSAISRASSIEESLSRALAARTASSAASMATRAASNSCCAERRMVSETRISPTRPMSSSARDSAAAAVLAASPASPSRSWAS